MGRGSQPLLNQLGSLRSLGQRCKCPQRGQGQSSGRKCILGMDEPRKQLKLSGGRKDTLAPVFLLGGGDRLLAPGIDATA